MTTATQQSTSYGRRDADQVGDPYTEAYSRGDGGQSPRGLLGDPERVARGLGWFSIGLGLAQVAAPRTVARMIGVDDDDTNRNTMLAIGVREIASGVGILTRERPVGPVWSRVGGDMMDLALLSRALGSGRSEKNRVAAATAAVVGVTILDVLTGQGLRREAGAERGTDGAARARGKGIEVRQAITVWAPQDEVYRFWRNFENLPRFMKHLESVRVLDDRRSHWKASAPAGMSVEWDAEIIEDRPNELIAWRAVDNADVPNRGSVRFQPSPQGGTEVLVELSYAPPGGRLGSIVAKLFGEEPDIQVGSDLRRFKQVIELGEVVHSDASIFDRPHPARPPEKPVNVQGQTRAAMQGAMR
jgi:uncharacterized membrane protein